MACAAASFENFIITTAERRERERERGGESTTVNWLGEENGCSAAIAAASTKRRGTRCARGMTIKMN